MVEDARHAAADFTGARPDEIAFGPNMTTLNFLLAHAVARTLEPGDEIVVTQLDHDANVSPWLRIADGSRADGAHGAAAHGRRHARPRRARGAPGQRPGADRGVHAGLQRARHGAPTRAGSPTSRTPPARWPGPTACTTRRTAASTAMRSASTCCCCSPYKFFGPHLGVAAIRHDLARSWPADRVRPAEEDAGRATASRRARSRTRRWRAWSPRSTTWPTLGEESGRPGRQPPGAPGHGLRPHRGLRASR